MHCDVTSVRLVSPAVTMRKGEKKGLHNGVTKPRSFVDKRRTN